MRSTAMAALGGALFCMAQSREDSLSFPEFIRAVKHAKAEQFVKRAGSQVKDAAAFDEMRRYVLSLYKGVHVQHSYQLDRQTMDCVPVEEQPSLRPGHGMDENASALPTERLAGIGGDANSACGEGTIPVRRVTLEQLTRFRTLSDFLHKEPHGRALIPPNDRPGG